jgi:CheY-like chemotaxis protein
MTGCEPPTKIDPGRKFPATMQAMNSSAAPQRAALPRIVGLCLGALWLMGLLAIGLIYLEGQQAIQRTAEQAVLEEARQVTQQLERQLGQAQSALDALGGTDLTPALNWNDPKASETRAWKVLQQHRQVAQLHWANRQGQVFEIEPLYTQGEFKALVAHREGQSGGRLQHLASQPLDRRERVGEDSVNYDVFLQAWWRTAVEQAQPLGRAAWSSPQVNVLRKDLSLYLSQAFVDPASPSQALGVSAVQVPLQSLKPLLSNGKLMPEALLYVTDSQGMLLASSEAVDTYKLEGGVPQLIAAKHSSSTVLSQAAGVLAQTPAASNGSQGGWRSLSEHGLLIHEQPVRASAGLVWNLVIVVPLSSLTAQLVRSSLIAVLLFTATAVLLAWWTYRYSRKSGLQADHSQGQWRAQQVEGQQELEHALTIKKQQLDTELQALQHTRDQFVAEASHELNTPLHAVKTAAALLSSTPLSSDQRELVNTLASASLQLQEAQHKLFTQAQTQAQVQAKTLAVPTGTEASGANAAMGLDSTVAQQWPLRILLVDDNSTNLKIGHLLLKRLGYQAKSALDGQQAVDSVRQAYEDHAAFDLVLMDMQMPVMDGMQASLAIMALSRELKLPCPCLVALSANALITERERARTAGLDEYLSKPIELSDLHRVLEMAYLRTTASGTAPAVPAETDASAQSPLAQALPVSVSHSAAAVMDFKRLDQLAQYDTDGSLIRDALADFQEQLPLTLEALAQAFKLPDFEAARQAAHKIKGSASNLGATALSRCAQKLEAAAQQSDASALQQGLAELQHVTEITLQALRERYH